MRRLPVLLVALVLVAPACSVFSAAPAATVDGDEITVDSIETEVETIRGNEKYIAQLEGDFGRPSQGSSEGTFDAAFVAQLLSLRVYYSLIERDLAARDLLPKLDDAVDELEQTIPEQFDAAFDAGSFARFPAAYRAQIIRQQAMFQVLQDDVAAEIGDDERAFFEANEDTFAEICVSHALVGLQSGLDETEAEARAQDLYERIQDGEDFGDIASNESDDPGAASSGGELGCGSRFSLQFDPVFEDAAFALEVGEVSEPVETQFGFHLILVTSRDTPRYREVADQVPSVMQAALSERFNERLVGAICGAEVNVNPRYGTWTVESCDGTTAQLPRVEPPEGPRGGADPTIPEQ